ncbi:MAG: tyrosine-type recombinase/integrase [Chloroflexi bacterium]|nr:tyrosine-type recombinase/integrase [Chloroflexota bacterium]
MKTSQTDLTIQQAIQGFLDSLNGSRSANTARTYANGMGLYKIVLADNGIDIESTPIIELSEDTILWLIADMKFLAPTTERLYLTSVTQFFEYLSAGQLANINLSRIKLLIHQRARRPGVRLPQFPVTAIKTVLAHAEQLNTVPVEDEIEKLRNLRDRAFLITLADTGLRVHEACGLRRGDIDWNESKAVVLGKGNREDVVRFSKRALEAIQLYLKSRAELDGASGRPLSSMPIFARHDKGVGKRINAMTTATGRNIVAQRVKEALGPEAAGTITPHSFRHYFVTTVLKASGNLKMAQALARHQNIAVTTRYAHLNDDELDRGYYEIFDEG